MSALVDHADTFSELEEQATQMTESGYMGPRSPDRLDALVWALSELSGAGGGGFSIIGVMGDGYFWEPEKPAAQEETP
jgi:hypothetical protein